MAARLAQLDAVALMAIMEGDLQKLSQNPRLTKRGLVTKKGDSHEITSEGRAALKKWAG
jgi:hypothetical protein